MKDDFCGGREEVEDVIGRDGVVIDLLEDVMGEMLAKRSLMLDVVVAATGFGAAKGVDEVIVEVIGRGGDDVRPEKAVRGASVVRPGVVAD